MGPKKTRPQLPPARVEEKAMTELPERLLTDIRGYIDVARGRAAVAVNAEMVMLYWPCPE